MDADVVRKLAEDLSRVVSDAFEGKPTVFVMVIASEDSPGMARLDVLDTSEYLNTETRLYLAATLARLAEAIQEEESREGQSIH